MSWLFSFWSHQIEPPEINVLRKVVRPKIAASLKKRPAALQVVQSEKSGITSDLAKQGCPVSLEKLSKKEKSNLDIFSRGSAERGFHPKQQPEWNTVQ